MTVKDAGTYYAYVDSTSATGLGANARYNLSVRIIPKQVQADCTIIPSTDVPVTLGPDVGTATSTIVVPPTITGSITDVNLLIDLTHLNMPDLDVSLVSPAATSVPLFTDIGASTQTVMNLGLDENAALPIGDFHRRCRHGLPARGRGRPAVELQRPVGRRHLDAVARRRHRPTRSAARSTTGASRSAARRRRRTPSR